MHTQKAPATKAEKSGFLRRHLRTIFVPAEYPTRRTLAGLEVGDDEVVKILLISRKTSATSAVRAGCQNL